MSEYVNKNGTFNHGKWLRDQTVSNMETNSDLQEITGYDDPKFPKAKYHTLVKAMEAYAKVLGKEKMSEDTIYGSLNSMSTRISKKYGK